MREKGERLATAHVKWREKRRREVSDPNGIGLYYIEKFSIQYKYVNISVNMEHIKTPTSEGIYSTMKFVKTLSVKSVTLTLRIDWKGIKNNLSILLNIWTLKKWMGSLAFLEFPCYLRGT